MYDFVRTNEQREMVRELEKLRPLFKKREPLLDQLNSLPKENIDALKGIGYHTLTLSKQFGGQGMGLYSFVLGQELIAKGSGATALSIGWHVGSLLEFSEKRHWNKNVTDWLLDKIKQGALINTASTEKGAGSPMRGALPGTTATQSGDHWVISGKKSYTSLAPLIDYFFVTATIEKSQEIATFVVPRETTGVSILKTWDSVGMRGTASHDLVMDKVVIPKDFILKRHDKKSKPWTPGWQLHIPACYIGIAGAARDEAVEFAASYTPASLGKPIGSMPNIQQEIGEMDIQLLSARQVLYHAAQSYEESNDKEQLRALLSSAKVTVTNAAIDIVDKAMRIVGPQAMSQKNPMQRYYLDVRMGLHNPPMEDMVKKTFGEQAIKTI
ncbi:acyl-CoA dehydrogenase family protein [Jeotgalibacillus marinus]|uniref:acyl-CoA dehydrogenase family protein n=1 Tax=Jeotgalibacillus marinus TaxID=86667 RepID=UPI003F5C48AB